MDKKSFNLLFTLVATSMVILGTYKISKKKDIAAHNHVPAVVRHK